MAKAITWRIIASTITFVLTLSFFKGNHDISTKASWVTLIEISLKMILYYSHEKAWYICPLKLKNGRRHLLKTVTWRVLASLTTFTIAFFIFREDSQAIEKATSIAIAESILKMLFYYIHERVWYRSKYGLDQMRNE